MPCSSSSLSSGVERINAGYSVLLSLISASPWETSPQSASMQPTTPDSAIDSRAPIAKLIFILLVLLVALHRDASDLKQYTCPSTDAQVVSVERRGPLRE